MTESLASILCMLDRNLASTWPNELYYTEMYVSFLLFLFFWCFNHHYEPCHEHQNMIEGDVTMLCASGEAHNGD